MRQSRRMALGGRKHHDVPIGTTWEWPWQRTAYSFTVLESGYYTIEVHGGGGGSYWSQYAFTDDGWGGGTYYVASSGGGGGSGNIWTNQLLIKGQVATIFVASGGKEGQIGHNDPEAGGTSYFTVTGGTNYSCAGGNPSSGTTGGTGVGNMASNGGNGASGTDPNVTIPGGSLGSGGRYPFGTGADGHAFVPGSYGTGWHGQSGKVFLTLTGY